MLAGKYRFHSRGGVKYVYRNGRTVRGKEISIVYLRDNRRRRSRFAVVVSKKVLKSAVGRNRIRRRIYEAVRGEMPKMRESVDVIVMVYSREVVDMGFGDLVGVLREGFSGAGLYR